MPGTRTKGEARTQRKDERNMTSWEFPGSDPIDIIVNLAAGTVALSGEPTDVTTVNLESGKSGRQRDEQIAAVQVSFDQGRLEIIQPKPTGFLRSLGNLDLTVKAPAGSRCTVRTASADVAGVGDLAQFDANTASGDVTAASVSGPLRVTTASGDVWLEDAGAGVDVDTASGDIRLRQAAGDISVNTASGDIRIGTAGASVETTTASGDVQIGSVSAGHVRVKTVSGDTMVGVTRGAGVYLDLYSLTGRITSQLEESDSSTETNLEVNCRSVSGDIKVTRADATAAGNSAS
jgi:Putative adhesin